MLAAVKIRPFSLAIPSSLTCRPCGIYRLRGGRADDFCRTEIAARKLVSLKKKSDSLRADSVWTRATAMLLLVFFCASSVPIPIRSWDAPHTESSESYPCKGGRCGCKSAHQCWTSCCCNSPAKRLAWAKKNQVTPPSYAVLEEPAKAAPASEADLRKKISSNGTCDSCCGARSKSGNGTDLVVSNASQAKPPFVHRKTNKSLVLTMLAFKCQGKDSVFTYLPWMTLPMALPIVAMEDVTESFDCPRMRILISVPLDLDTPPPKATFA